MNISAQITNREGQHQVSLRTDRREHSLIIAPKEGGFGSSANGGELLFLALATCYCNDIYREARKRHIDIQQVDVEVSGEFGGEGEAARNIRYSAFVAAKTPQDVLVQPEMERRRSPLVSIPPLGRGFSRHRYRPPGYPSAWLRPRGARFRFAREDHCSSTTAIRLNFRLRRHPPTIGSKLQMELPTSRERTLQSSFVRMRLVRPCAVLN
jgi:organic hydroperoxide reductase OsmC/OhrA